MQCPVERTKNASVAKIRSRDWPHATAAGTSAESLAPFGTGVAGGLGRDGEEEAAAAAAKVEALANGCDEDEDVAVARDGDGVAVIDPLAPPPPMRAWLEDVSMT